MKAIAILMWLLFSTVDLREQTSNDTSTPLIDDSCPPWQVRNKTGICKCVIGDIQSIVKCRDEPYSLQLLECFCMTYYTETNQSLVGSCQYTCERRKNGHFFDITVDTCFKLNERMCSRYKRQGQLCGSCIAGFSPPVYSYSLSCVNCTTSNWAKYTAVSLLPVTGFFFIAITFRLSATSPKLSGCILCIQMILTPSNMRLLESTVHHRPLYDPQGHIKPQLYLFNQGNVAFLSNQHLPYTCLAMFFLLIFTLTPILLLFLYPCSCFQVCLNRTGCSCQLLHTFMDTFQGHYKNGTNGTRDLRFFSGLYLLLRVVVYASTVLSFQFGSYAYTTVVIAVLSVSVALARPYKEYIYNIIDSCFLIVTALLYVLLVPLAFGEAHKTQMSLSPLIVLFVLMFLVYFVMLLLSRSKLMCLRLFSRCHHFFSGGYESLHSY